MWALTARVYIMMRAWRRRVLGPGPSVPPALRPGQSRPAPELECSAPRPCPPFKLQSKANRRQTEWQADDAAQVPPTRNWCGNVPHAGHR